VALPVLAGAVSPASAAPDGNLKILLFYKSNFHASHVQARQAVKDLAAELAAEHSQVLEIQETEDPSAFTTANLADKDAVVFAQTGGVLFNQEQRSALEAYIRGGGGYMGLHYAGWSAGTVSEHDVNPFYARLVGAVSEGHPENPGVRSGRVYIEDPTHPLVEGLSPSITRNDEWYDWNVNPAPNVRTLVLADESSYNSLGHQGTTHPITWCQGIDSGRSWYTGMGHDGTAYSEPYMRTMMSNGLAYAAGLVAADCSPPAKDEHGAWSGVTPWPLMPINMALTSDGKVQSFGSVSSGCTDGNPYDWGGNGCITQGGQTEIDVWDPAQPRTLANVRDGVIANTTYTDLFCSMQVQNPHRKTIMTVGGDDSLGGNAPNDAAIGVTSYSTNSGLRDEAPMNYPRWYPTGTTLPDGSIVVQGGSLKGGPGGPGVITPEIYNPDEGNGWRLLDGATSPVAYGDGGADHEGQDENRWWYPRAFVVPGKGTVFNISGTQMFELDPSGDGRIDLRGKLPSDIANQGPLGNPVGATSTAAMYRPGKILQVGGGWWANGGGPQGARAGFTVDLTGPGGTADPVVQATEPMKFARHWATATVLPDGDVLVTGGSRENNGDGGYVTTPEIWDPDTGEWTTVEVPYEHARLYHSTALLLPDGRVMIGGGGAPGPRNYTDVEYYSPAYLFDGDQPAERPEITDAPARIGYDGTFEIQATGPVSRVTLVRNGSVTHGFNNDQNFQDLEFSQTDGSLTITAPTDGTYAPPGSYMLFVFDEDGTPSVAEIVDIDPAVRMDQRTPQVVDQFEYPKLPAEWRSANPPMVVDVAPGNGRMSPWEVDSQVQLVRGAHSSQGGLGLTGYHLGLGAAGSLERTLKGLDPGRDYRISLRYARDSRSATGAGPATAELAVGSLTETLTATTDNPSQNSGRTTTFGTYVGTFTADSRTETLRLSAPGTGAGMMIDDLVVIGVDPGTSDVPIHYEFEEGEGTTAANTGTDTAVGPATLTGATGWSDNGVFGGSLDLSGGANTNAVDLPDNLLQDAGEFTTSFWVRPDAKANWIGLFHIGDGLGDQGSFFQIQMQTQAQGNTGLAATFKAKGSNLQERVYATPTQDVTAQEWNHVVFTRQGSTGTLYLNGEQIASRDDLTIDMTDVGPTSNNWLGRNGYPDPAYDGLMDDVRIYRSVLTPDDVAAMFDEGAALRTTTSVSVTPASPSPFAEPVTVSAEVEDENGQPASGTAELWVDGERVGAPVDVVDGAATFPELTLSSGDHDIEVRYQAADGWRGSVGSVTHTVERPPVGEGVPIHYTFDEGQGGVAGNTGSDPSVGDANLLGATSWSPDGKYGAALSLPGGPSSSENHVRLPDNIDAGMDDEFTVSLWVRPDSLPNWVPHVQIGSSTDTFFLLQSSTQTAGNTGFAATFKEPGNPNQERLVLGPGNDVPLNEWTHVVFTMSGSTGKIYFDGELMGTRTDFTIDIGDVGVDGQTTMNLLGGTSWPDARFDGLIDDFRMYGYELSAEQVQELFEGPPPEPVDTTVAATTSAVTYGRTGAVNATVTPATATGDVEVLAGTRSLGTAPLADGKARVVLPARSLAPGTHTLTVRYGGDEGHAASSTTVRLTVKKAVPAMRVTAPKAVKRGQRPTVKVVLTAPNQVGVTGKVRFAVKGGRTITKALKGGKVAVRLPRATRVGKLRVTVSYLGSRYVAPVTKKVVIAVRR
jgi:type 1 glutamine amidotransferase